MAIGGYKWEAMTWVIGHPRSSHTCKIVPPLLSGAARYSRLTLAKLQHKWFVDTSLTKDLARLVISRTC